MILSENLASTRNAFDKGEEVFVDLIFVGGAQAVRRAFIDFKRRRFDQFGGEQAGIGDGDDLIVIAVKDQSRDVEPLEVFSQIGFRERQIGRAHV